MLGRTGLVAVVSNDIDFGALFVKVQEMAIQRDLGRTPFLWVISEGGGALSPEVECFVPDEIFHPTGTRRSCPPHETN